MSRSKVILLPVRRLSLLTVLISISSQQLARLLTSTVLGAPR